jgi:hypothetical protein
MAAGGGPAMPGLKQGGSASGQAVWYRKPFSVCSAARSWQGQGRSAAQQQQQSAQWWQQRQWRWWRWQHLALLFLVSTFLAFCELPSTE